MDKKALFTLYRELYFHEMDVKEKLVARTQISFAIVVTAFTAISYMLRMLDFSSNFYAIAFFIVFVSISTLILFASIWFLVQAFSWRHYRGIPSPEEIDQYRTKLIKYNDELHAYNEENPNNHQEIDDVDDVMESYLYDKFKFCSTHNTKVNDGRSGFARDGFKWILSALLPLSFASGIFIITDLDTSSPRKELLIKDANVATQLVQLTKQVELLKSETSKLKKESIMVYAQKVTLPLIASESCNIKSETALPAGEIKNE